MATFVYDYAKRDIARGDIDMLNDTIKAFLVTTTMVENNDHQFVSSITGEITTGGGVRKTLASKTLEVDTTSNRAEFDAADVTWTAINAGTIDGVIIFKDAGGADTANPLITHIDLTDFATNGGDFTLQWNTEGILQFT